ncbi:MAG: hypothetical protein HQK65_01685 [Desulfamplus sp.]|nr:hypothetical protein [Desulfamplus sp.]
MGKIGIFLGSGVILGIVIFGFWLFNHPENITTNIPTRIATLLEPTKNHPENITTNVPTRIATLLEPTKNHPENITTNVPTRIAARLEPTKR